MKILITGASGFVGSHLLDVMEENNVQVFAIDKAINSNINVRYNVNTICCNLDEVEKLPELIKERDFDCCIHLAWQGANGKDRGDSDIQIKNIQRTINLCKILPQLNVKRFVGIGTLAEKDVDNYIPTDGATPNLVACYGVAKMSAQYMSKIICTSLGIEHIWCQLSNLYGVGDYTSNFINFACKLMLEGKRASFTLGEQMYDFVYITDIAQGIYLAATKGKANTCYYIGSGNQKKLKYFIEDIRNAIDSSIQIHFGEIPFNGVSLPDNEFDSTKLEKDTGYKSSVSFEDGINRTINWLKEIMVK